MSRVTARLRAAGGTMGALLALSACAALHAPDIKTPTLRAQAPVLTQDLTAAEAQWPAGNWWTRYNDPSLNALIDLALKDGPSLATADARFAAAQESVRLSGAAQGLKLDASGSFMRQRISDNGLFPPQFLGFNWYNEADLGVSARYTFDWWGKQRASIAAAVNESKASQAERIQAQLLLSAAVAQAYFGWQSDQQRLALARERITLQERQSRITDLRIKAQLDNGDTARVLNGYLAMTRGQVAELEGSLRLRIVALAALLGRNAEELPPLTVQALPHVGGRLPESVRLDLIARRPDITASRWRVEAAQQNLVSTRAEYFPDVTINALAALSSIEIGKLLQSGSAAPQLGVAIHLPLFDNGLRAARFGAGQAQVAAAVAGYDEVVIGAAREVATAASQQLSVAAQEQQSQIELDEARALVASAAARVAAGTADARVRLNADLAVNTGLDAIEQLNFAALSADIALQRALGGGYVAREETP